MKPAIRMIDPNSEEGKKAIAKAQKPPMIQVLADAKDALERKHPLNFEQTDRPKGFIKAF